MFPQFVRLMYFIVLILHLKSITSNYKSEKQTKVTLVWIKSYLTHF